MRCHQELKKCKSEISNKGTMNLTADKLTKDARQYKPITKYHHLPQNPVNFSINNIMIDNKYSQRSKIAHHSTIPLRALFH